MSKKLKVLAAGQTDVGQVRSNNEDAFCLLPEKGLLLVADGMGGHAAGEIASRMAVDVISRYFDGETAGVGTPLIGTYNDDVTDITNRLGSAIRMANLAIHEASQSDSQWQGMGTTVVCALLHNHKLSIAHVGDSRLYLIRAGDIEQLTDDHSVVAEQVNRELITREEAKKSEIKNILTRALGTETEVDVDLGELNMLEYDALVLCTDGLTNMVQDDDILSVVLSEEDPAVASQRLVALANDRGGKDNITVIVAYLRKENWLTLLRDYLGFYRRWRHG